MERGLASNSLNASGDPRLPGRSVRRSSVDLATDALLADLFLHATNCVRAFEWAKAQGLKSIALVGAKRGKMADLADQPVVIPGTHYGRVEDAQMTILHLLAYAFWENPNLAK